MVSFERKKKPTKGVLKNWLHCVFVTFEFRLTRGLMDQKGHEQHRGQSLKKRTKEVDTSCFGAPFPGDFSYTNTD